MKIKLRNQHEDFPGGTVGKNLPPNGGNTGSIPWSRKIPHAMEPLSL